MRALNELVVGRTVIMISHRLSTLGNVDEIIALKMDKLPNAVMIPRSKKRGGDLRYTP